VAETLKVYMSRKTDRVAELIKQEVAKLIQKELDPNQALVTITSVQVTADLRWADVWVSIYRGKRLSVIADLAKKKRFIQSGLGRQLRRMRRVPKIKFKIDDSGEYADRLERLLKRVKRN